MSCQRVTCGPCHYCDVPRGRHEHDLSADGRVLWAKCNAIVLDNRAKTLDNPTPTRQDA